MAYRAVFEAYTVLQEGRETVRGGERHTDMKLHLLMTMSTEFGCYSSSSSERLSIVLFFFRGSVRGSGSLLVLQWHMLVKCQTLPPSFFPLSLDFSPPVERPCTFLLLHHAQRETKSQSMLSGGGPVLLSCSSMTTTAHKVNSGWKMSALVCEVLCKYLIHSLEINSSPSNLLMHFQFKDVWALRSTERAGELLVNSCCQVEPLLLSWTHVAIFAAEVMHHNAVGIPGKRTERERQTKEDLYSLHHSR